MVKGKRQIGDVMEVEGGEVGGDMDEERYVSRVFTPFVDRPF